MLLLLLMMINIKKSPITGPKCPEGSMKLRFPDYVTMTQDGGKVVSLTQRPLLPPRKYSRYSFLLEAESTPGPQCDRKDFMSMKNPPTPAGIEPATFRFVAQPRSKFTTYINYERVPNYRIAGGPKTIVCCTATLRNETKKECNTESFRFYGQGIQCVRNAKGVNRATP